MAGNFVSDGDPLNTEAPEAAADQADANTPASLGSFLGATVQAGPTMGLSRAQQRGTQEGSSWFDQWINITGQTEAGLPIEPTQKSPTISPEEANKRFAPAGESITDQPLPEGLARILGQQKTDEINRNSTLSRYEQAHFAPMNFGAGTMGFLLDPMNSSTMFLPGVGEETMVAGAGRLGLDTTGILARTGARLGAGATAGLVAQAPLTALQLGLSADSNGDYGLRDAARDLMFGAAAGAIFHAGFGALGDAYRSARGMPAIEAPAGVDTASITDADAQTKADAMKSAVSQMADGREIDVTPVFDATAANKAQAELSSWYAQSARLAAETDAALRAADAGTGTAADLTTKLQTVTDQLERLRSEHAGFMSDMQGAQDRLGQAVDTETPQRIAAIDSELSQSGTPAPRREELTAERTMLTEGAAQPPAAEALEQARTQAEIEGLQTGMQRVAGQIASLEKRAGPLQEKATATAAQSDASLKIKAARIESREKIVNAMTARSIRRYAGRIGARLDPGEDAAFASRIMSGGKEEIPKILEELRGRVPQASEAAASALIPPAAAEDAGTTAMRENIQAPAQQWAPESQARDANGGLVPVYHGTLANFDHFDSEKLGSSTGDANTQHGFFFSESRNVAERYGTKPEGSLERALQTLTLGGYKYLKEAVRKLFGTDTGRVLAAHLDAKNPKTVDLPGGDYYSEFQVEEALRRAKEEGYDAVKFRSLDDNGAPRPEGNMWVAFDPKQIKIVDHGNPALNARMAEAEHPAPDAQLLAEANDRFGRTAQSVIADTAARQQDIYRNGYAPGIPQAEFNEMNEAIYGAKPAKINTPGSDETGVPAAKRATAESDEGKNTAGETQAEGAPEQAEGEVSPAVAAVQKMLDDLGPIPAADRAEIEAAFQGMRDADLQEQAYQQAGECLKDAFL